ncbi:MAG: hypothetical protein IJ795_08300 [Bacteroidales bacterium]|nr:hypothetical protein [Bacteroidales bacterium]
MKRLFFLILVICACARTSPRTSLTPWDGRHRLPAESEPARNDGDTVAYITAVEFPEGHDWRKGGDGEQCLLTLFAGQRRVLSVEAGRSGGPQPDPDRNHIIDKHLYSDYFDSGQTVVARDGEELLRFEGRELFKGMALTEDGLWTLGESLGGSGFTLRLNGKDMFARAFGSIVGGYEYTVRDYGALALMGGVPEFAYTSAEGILFRVSDCEAVEQPLSAPAVKVFDAAFIDGSMWTAGLSGQGNILVYCDGVVKTGFDTSRATAVYGVSLIHSGDNLYVKARFSLPDGQRTYIWDLRGRPVYVSGSDVCPYMAGNEIVVFATEENEYATAIPLQAPGDRLLGNSCALWKDGHSWAAVTPSDDLMFPYLLKDGRRLAIMINGYLTSLEVYP